MAAHSTASSGVVVAGGEAARFGAALGGGLNVGGADGWLDLSELSGLRDDLMLVPVGRARRIVALAFKLAWEGTSGRSTKLWQR